jgi:outer membrane protein assembly factor BamB
MSHSRLASVTLIARWVPAVLLLVATTSAADDAGVEPSRQWGQWRGPLATGEAPHADPPIQWSEVDNLRWKVALPGIGHSTPIVWHDRVYLTAALPIGEAQPPRYSGAPGAHDNSPITHRHRFIAFAVDRRTGVKLWQKTLNEQMPHEGAHFTASLASNSPVTDGKRIFVFFGSYGLYCLNPKGELLWSKDFGRQHTKHGHGEGSSPALFGETLIVNWDHEGRSFVVALDAATGRQNWKVMRDEVTSWSTPIVVQHDGQRQVIVCGTDRIRSYDLASGQVIWECGGLSANIVASPVAADGMLFAGSSYDTRAMLAIRMHNAKGDITGSDRIAWRLTRGTPYVPSPLLYNGSLFFLRHYQGILSRISATTGESRGGPFRLGALRDIYASPVAAAGRIYITDLDGTTMVIQDDEEPKVLAVNRLNDSFSASAALVDDELFLRGRQRLYCIADQP